MPLTEAQQTTLAADIAADPVLSQLPHNADSADVVRVTYNQPASPDYWVYTTMLAERTVYEATSADNTTWDWTTYIAQNAREAEAWGRMFASGQGRINPALPQVRAAVDKIFGGTGQAVQAQRAHCHSLFRVKATRVQALFASGSGSTSAPATMTFEGPLTGRDVEEAWAT